MDLSFSPETVVGGRYIIKKTLGQGGMGAVYLAEHQSLGTDWALKQMLDQFGSDPESQAEKEKAVRQFNAEAKMLAQLNHKNLPKVIDFFQDNNSYLLVMEYIEGQTLGELQEKAKPGFLEEETVLEWAIQVCEVLDYLHNRQPPIIFRDLKPANIMLTKDGTIKLIDFGIAKMFDPTTKTQTAIRGTGTIGFLPPEQYGALGSEARSDIYAMGATLYVLLTHQMCPVSIDRLINKAPMTPPSKINPAITPETEECILKALELKRDNRHQSAMEMKQVLEECLHKTPDEPIEITTSEDSEDMEEDQEEKVAETAQKEDKWDIFSDEEEHEGRKLSYPIGVTVDLQGNIYIVDTNSIQKFDSDGKFIKKWGTNGQRNGQFMDPLGIASDISGNIYVADSGNHRIQKFNCDGKFLKKWGAIGYENNKFLYPSGITVDAMENFYVVDTGNHCIKKFDPSGKFLKKWGNSGNGDGQFQYPTSIALDASNNIYVVDSANNRVQKFDSKGSFITKWTMGGYNEGQFYYLIAIGIDISGYSYLVDYWNNEIQKFDLLGTFKRKWGPSSADKKFRFIGPSGIAVDPSGNVYIVDKGNHCVKKFNGPGKFIRTIGIEEEPGDVNPEEISNETVKL